MACPSQRRADRHCSDGLLWPIGKVPNYSQISRILQAASKAVRSEMSSAKVAIHLNNGWDSSLQLDFYSNVLSQGHLTITDVSCLTTTEASQEVTFWSQFDITAVSFYPFYGTGATMSALAKSASALVAKYDKVRTVPRLST